MIKKPKLLHIEIFSHWHETIRNIVSSPLPSLDWKHVYSMLLVVTVLQATLLIPPCKENTVQ